MAEKKYTLDEAFAELQSQTIGAGRCPHCGRRQDSEEAKLFKSLREDRASEADRANKAEAKIEKLGEERDVLKVRNADLRADNKELRAG